MPPRSRRPATATLMLAAVLTVVAACGEPPQVAPTPTGPLLPGPRTPGPATPPPPPTSGVPGTVTPPAGRAVDCAGNPSAEEVLDLLREEALLTSDADVTVADGPRCDEDWQYTLIEVPGLDPLQVVTSGKPGDLELVTAGTDVCTVEVRVRAPDGIRAAASCVG
ncbi:MAG TPA: hypothetical protein VKY81_06850 [Natronosporangium sp.]|nr:hypothetical protein [Natronosporangium sp.]